MAVLNSVAAPRFVTDAKQMVLGAMAALLLIVLMATPGESRAAGESTEKFDAMTYYDLGRQHFQMDEWAQAIESYSKAIMVDARFAQAYYRRGEAYYFLAEKSNVPRLYDLAIADFNKCLKLDPRKSQARLYRAYCYQKVGDFEKANKELENRSHNGKTATSPTPNS
ncbi:MAG TPA: tetratricopeptide repeat protein [Candidatus Obscuribacterales bacterium]